MITDKTQIKTKTELNQFLLGMKESERFGWIMDNWDIIRKVAPDVATIVEGATSEFLGDIGKSLFDVLKEVRDVLSQVEQAKDKSKDEDDATNKT